MNAEQSAEFLATRPAEPAEGEAAKVRRGGTASSSDGKPPLSHKAMAQLGQIVGRVAKRAIDAEVAKLRAELSKKIGRLSPAYLKSLAAVTGDVVRRKLDADVAALKAELAEAARVAVQSAVDDLQKQIEQVRSVREISEYSPDGQLVSTAVERYIG
ncbi:MAG TPA: hypothetical protein VHW66_09365 [Stellaceae bacterium]|jgi:hypothetical protein|nr:hypothetical protein [Stellaceae bacterium]